MSDHPVQIITYNLQSKQYELNKAALEGILLKDDVKDLNIAIVSISGAVRKGKSFLLSFLLKYLGETYVNNNQNWLANENDELSGFAWRGGSQRHTTGIWIWSKIYTKVLPSGEKVGVMLMDTQGIFDTTTTLKDNVTIFSLSTMLASVQIYNLFNNIQQDDLENLRLFTEYGKIAKTVTAEKPFQQLMFLVRDWHFPYELGYGVAGGNELLNEVLNENEPAQNDEILSVRKHIRSCFEKIDCFLMPYPGKVVTHSQQFRGQLKDIDVEFKNMLKIFAPLVLAPENLQLKKINGQKVLAKDLINFFEIYLNVFRSGQMPTVQNILKATIEANIMTQFNLCVQNYHQQMKAITGPEHGIRDLNFLLQQHNSISSNAVAMFKKNVIFGDAARRQSEADRLTSTLLTALVYYQQQNDSRRNTDLVNRQNILNSEFQQHHNTYASQQNTVQALSNQINEMRRVGDQEILTLTQQLQNIQNSF